MNAQTTTKPRETSNTRQQGSKPRHDELPVEVAENVAEAATQPKSAKAKSIFAMSRASVSEAAVAKMQLLGQVRQELAQVADTVAEGKASEEEITEISSRNALRLYEAMRDNVLSRDELTGLLGDVFGYRVTPKGETSKTPNPAGDAIRKRVIRLWKAHDIVENNAEPDNFFKSVPEDALEETLDRVNSGNLSVWQAYDNLQKAKNDNTTRVALPFDPNRIAKIAEGLSEKGAAAKIAANPALVTAYASLIDVLEIVGQEAASL